MFALGSVTVAAGGVQAAETRPTPAPMTFANGSVATAEERCGAGELCATLKLANGDTISVYNGGAVRCKPYTVKIVRMHGDTKLFDYDAQTDTQHGFMTSGTCSDTFANTYLTIGNGGARLGIFQNTDGSLFARWTAGGGSGPAAQPEATAPPGPWSSAMANGHPKKCRSGTGIFGAIPFDWETDACAWARAEWNRRFASPSPVPTASPQPTVPKPS